MSSSTRSTGRSRDGVAVDAGDGVGDEQRVGDRLLAGVDDRSEDGVERLVGEQTRVDEPGLATLATVRRRGREEDVAAAVMGHRSDPTESESDAPRHTLQLAGVERDVGHHDPDARTAGVELGRDLALGHQRLSYGHPADPQQPRPAEVAQQQHTDRSQPLEHARGGADAALVPHRAHARAGTHDAFRNRSRLDRVDRLAHVGDGQPAFGDVVEMGVVALADDRVDDVRDPRFQRGIDDGVEPAADVVRRDQHDRRPERSPLARRERSGELAGAVEHGHVARHRVAPERGGLVGRDDRASGTADGSVVLVAPHGHLPDADAWHVGDRVVLAGRQRAEVQSECAGARPRCGGWHGGQCGTGPRRRT